MIDDAVVAGALVAYLVLVPAALIRGLLYPQEAAAIRRHVLWPALLVALLAGLWVLLMPLPSPEPARRPNIGPSVDRALADHMPMARREGHL